MPAPINACTEPTVPVSVTGMGNIKNFDLKERNETDRITNQLDETAVSEQEPETYKQKPETSSNK